MKNFTPNEMSFVSLKITFSHVFDFTSYQTDGITDVAISNIFGQQGELRIGNSQD